MPHDPLAPFLPRLETVTLAGRAIELFVLDDDAVLDALTAAPARDGAPPPDNPYFGLLWESAIVLARRAAGDASLAGAHVLDLGCGAGLTGIAAALAGARVTFADVMEEAVKLSRRNAARSGVAGEFVRFDLRDPKSLGAARFDVVLASDVLYERGKPNEILAALERLLAPRGRAILTDPMRPTADAFEAAARTAGFAVTTSTEAIATERATILVRVFELARAENER